MIHPEEKWKEIKGFASKTVRFTDCILSTITRFVCEEIEGTCTPLPYNGSLILVPSAAAFSWSPSLTVCGGAGGRSLLDSPTPLPLCFFPLFKGLIDRCGRNLKIQEYLCS